MVEGGVLVREMTAADIPAGLRFCRASGWNQTARDWEYFLTVSPRGGLAAVENGSVIGTAIVLPYGPFAWVSMVLVDPNARGRGVGTRLLKQALALVPAGSSARLDATPAGERVYRPLGFTAEYRLARLCVDANTARRAAPPGARPVVPGDWPAVLERDQEVFGAPRAALLRRLADEAPQYAWVVAGDHRPRGYLFGRHGHVREHLGPLVADDPATAAVLLDTCLARHADRRFSIDVPDDQHVFRARLVERGFSIERPFLRMRLGPPTHDRRSEMSAVAGPELG